jgi:cytochrome c553
MAVRFVRRFVCLAMATVASPLWADSGDPVAGKEKSTLCRGCHGDAGISVIADYPKLAGQRFGYLVKQLLDFQVQNRTDARMSPIAAGMNNAQDMRDIAAYFASLPAMTGSPRSAAARGRVQDVGRRIFENGIPERGMASCASCHGSQGKGDAGGDASFPLIGGQHAKYAIKQLKDFQSGARNTDAVGAMAEIAKALTPFEIEAVAEYAAAQ